MRRARAWRSYGEFEGRSSLWTWLYRIATNACLRALETRARRPLPSGLGAPGEDPAGPLAAARPEVPWLQPIPDALLSAGTGDPAEIAMSRASVRLALIAATRAAQEPQRNQLVAQAKALRGRIPSGDLAPKVKSGDHVTLNALPAGVTLGTASTELPSDKAITLGEQTADTGSSVTFRATADGATGSVTFNVARSADVVALRNAEDAIRALDPGLEFEAALRSLVELLQRRAIDIWRIASAVGPRFHHVARPTTQTSQPLVAFFKAHRARIATTPAEAARLLRALTISLTHPALAEEPMPPKRIVDLFLHGAGAAPC